MDYRRQILQKMGLQRFRRVHAAVAVLRDEKVLMAVPMRVRGEHDRLTDLVVWKNPLRWELEGAAQASPYTGGWHVKVGDERFHVNGNLDTLMERVREKLTELGYVVLTRKGTLD